MLPAAALGQASRTWISGVGDDVNPCSRTAPCKTFAGAISKTAVNGEIDCLDSGGFGTVTITKSITLRGRGTVCHILASGVSGVTINGAGVKVKLYGIQINGFTSCVSGVRVLQAAQVYMKDVEIQGCASNGVDLSPSTLLKTTIVNSDIVDNGADGILARPAAGGEVRLDVRNTTIEDNNTGVLLDAPTRKATAVITDSQVSGNGIGLRAVGALARMLISGDVISGNGLGLQAQTTGSIISFGDNRLSENTTDGAPTSTITKK
jgi:hypothetical protein